ncbi:MAG: type II toxin-antitoxin system RelE/ParE family toxin [Pigmentiphaga sp.]|uniref:type II toxin-antitoxin system RelE/ParE family toxin n=1 Tax=unclassified Pigmentiphaga TaxID=2626614 RepID=UPI000B420733|nr:hypothetical protein CDO46_23870 [Pigmentiphaga sp. NML030171]
MSRTLQITDSAEQDLAEIWSYIAEGASEATATRFLNKLYGTCERLLAYPLGHPERRQLGRDLRVVFHGAYAIYYQASETAVVIVRVLHGMRDLGAIADQGGFDI